MADHALPLRVPENGRSVVLGVSSTSTPNATILSICERQGLEYYPLRFVNDLAAALEEIHPAAIAWDMSEYDPQEWSKIQQLREHPELNQIPFLVFKQEGPSSQSTITNILTKPIKEKSLFDYLQTLRPEVTTAPILVVDDAPQTRRMYRKMIEQKFPQFALVAASAGSEAIKMLGDITPAAIVLDLMMPEVDGFKVLESVRR